MIHGTLTIQMAHALAQELEPQGFVVLHDHHQPGVDSAGKLGKPRSWFGPIYAAHALLADLDIVVAAKDTDQLIALVEIEETTDKPKVLLGDVLATLLGDYITFQGQQFQAGPWTSLIVLAHSTNPTHQDRIRYLETQVNHLKDTLNTRNAKIGKVVIRSFQDKQDLEETLKILIQTSIAENNGPQTWPNDATH